MHASKCGIQVFSLIVVAVQVELSGTNYTGNNTVLLLDDIEENTNPLICRTDLIPCCRYPKQGDWFYPNGTRVQNKGDGYGFYRTRDDNMQVFLQRRSGTQSPMGSYCCQIPTAASHPHNKTFCVFLSKFNYYRPMLNVTVPFECFQHDKLKTYYSDQLVNF